jgi:hypothetical protein
MSISILSDVLKWLLSKRREQVVDARDSTKALAAELEGLAGLMERVLEVTGPDGRVAPESVKELALCCRTVWNRWCTILDSHGYASRDTKTQADVERCIEIAHAAPGAYVKEIYLVQIALGEGSVPTSVRERFAESIERLRNLAVKLRLNATA